MRRFCGLRGLSSGAKNPPIVALFVEGVQQRNFDVLGDGHVILHGVKGAQNQVEDAHRVPQLRRQLLNDYREAAPGTQASASGRRGTRCCESHVGVLIGVRHIDISPITELQYFCTVPRFVNETQQRLGTLGSGQTCRV